MSNQPQTISNAGVIGILKNSEQLTDTQISKLQERVATLEKTTGKLITVVSGLTKAVQKIHGVLLKNAMEELQEKEAELQELEKVV
jgi:SMC interacting uncharacterized protein involved in chromosome segregation